VRIAFGAIVGGAIGNIIDRFHYQFVVDFIDLRWWPVFNVADSCITVGVVPARPLDARARTQDRADEAGAPRDRRDPDRASRLMRPATSSPLAAAPEAVATP
jgi:hypothetical protein